MNTPEKIAQEYIRITEKLLLLHDITEFKPNYVQIVVDRIMEQFPAHAVAASLIFKDKVRDLGFTV